MIVTNEKIQNGEFDKVILSQIKSLCEEWVIRYPNSWGNDKDKFVFQLGFKLKDKNQYY